MVDDYWNRKVLHGLEIEQRPGLLALGVCVAVSSQAPVQLSSLQPGLCCMPRVQPRHYLTYYVLRALEHTSSVLRAHKEIACKLSEKFHHTEHRAAWASTTATARTTIW